jgi:hypothetical protein
VKLNNNRAGNVYILIADEIGDIGRLFVLLESEPIAHHPLC